MTVAVGQPAPDFELEASGGQRVKLSDYRGKHVVLYFYPKDMTSTCTTQACDFRDRSAEYADAGAVILGVSTDPAARHDKFIAKYELPFVLLADEEHQVSELYGVWQLKKNYGKEYMGIERSTFIIDKDGVLVKEWRKVRVKNHVEEALAFIREEL